VKPCQQQIHSTAKQINPSFKAQHQHGHPQRKQWALMSLEPVTAYLLFILIASTYIQSLIRRYRQFSQARDKIPWRVHVNGIRGKSSTTRYVAAIFRQLNENTYGKTTGSAARILLPDGSERPVIRRGLPNVNEQVRIVRQFCQSKADAIVMECMAVNPIYGEWLEQKLMRSQIGVLTNIRLDHTDYLGNDLESIAHALARSIPSNATLITAERNPKLQQILQDQAKAKGSRLVVAKHEWVSADSLKHFNHFAIEDNVAIGYAVADILGMPRESALKAMQEARPDPGSLQLTNFEHDDKAILWANLFAVNDRESFIELCSRLFKLHPNRQRIAILNNRHDRQSRVKLFSELARDLGFDAVVTFGDYEKQVNDVLTPSNCQILNCGNHSRHRDASGQTLLSTISSLITPGDAAILIGAVNIHTPQASRLLQAIPQER
jgi:poly-gamma-glutamate synthase PgsB/CapB